LSFRLRHLAWGQQRFDRLALNRRAIKLAWEVAVYGCSNFH